MYKSPSHLPEDARVKIADALNARLADGLDLHSQIKVAHWNIKGPQFAALHPLFETFAVSLANHNDTIAERAVTLGGQGLRHRPPRREGLDAARVPAGRRRATSSTSSCSPSASRPTSTGRASRASVGREAGDTDTVDLLTGVITEFEKHAWFLRASLEA